MLNQDLSHCKMTPNARSHQWRISCRIRVLQLLHTAGSEQSLDFLRVALCTGQVEPTTVLLVRHSWKEFRIHKLTRL